MWLQYALDKNDNLVSVNNCSKTSNYKCPYCQGKLKKKKCRVNPDHFIHVNQLCARFTYKHANDVGLPLYTSFDLKLSSKYLQSLLKQWENRDSDNPAIYNNGLKYLFPSAIVKFNIHRNKKYKGAIAYGDGNYELTKLGKIVVGGLSLNLFNQVQEHKITEELKRIEGLILTNKNILEGFTSYASKDYRELILASFKEYVTDYQIFLLEYQKILSNKLYFWEIQADDELYYRIEITTLSSQERIPEIQRELYKHFQDVSIKELGLWDHRGNVEYYFKYRYRKFNHPIGSLTEYFKFKDIKPVLRDLRQMKSKQLSDREREILENKPFEKTLLSLYIRHGMEKAKDSNIHIGRPKGETESTQKFLSKPKNQAIITVLKKGSSLRQTAKEVGVSVNTVRKVKAALEKEYNS